MLDTATSGFPRIPSGQFRALAVTVAGRAIRCCPMRRRSPRRLPGVHYMSWLGMAAAPRTPRPIVDRLNAELRRALDLPDVQQKLQEGGNIATPTTPEAMRQQMDDEIANWKQLDRGQQHQGGLKSALCSRPPAPRNFPAQGNATARADPSRRTGRDLK